MWWKVVTVVLMMLVLQHGALALPVKGEQGISSIGFTIQVGAFANVKNAERLTAKLQQKGIEAFYFRKENNVYAVRFGDFPSREDAVRAAEKLLREKMIGPYYIASPQATILQHPAEGVSRPKQDNMAPVRSAGEMGVIAARTAERFVGIPYRWGGNTVVDGMDRSGFARAVYNLCGVNIPRTSREQFRVGDTVPRDELAEGDLVFFGSSVDSITHVGIYVGGGRFVHAPRRGDDIKVSPLGDPYFDKKFIGAKRYL